MSLSTTSTSLRFILSSSSSSSVSTTSIMFSSTSSSTSTRTSSSSSPSSSSSSPTFTFTRRTTLVPTTLFSTSTLLTTSRVFLTLGQGTTTSSDVVFTTHVVVPVPTMILVDESPADSDQDSSSTSRGSGSGSGGGDSRGLADNAHGDGGMSPGTKVAAALAVGGFALVAVIVATVMLRRSGARERKRPRRASGSLSLAFGSTRPPPMLPRPASPFQPAVHRHEYAGQAHARFIEDNKSPWAQGMASGYSAPPAIQMQHMYTSVAPPPPPPPAPAPAPRPSTVLSAGSSLSFSDRILPPSPMLLAAAGPGTARQHVSRPIVGLSEAGRRSFASSVEWELPSATVGRGGEEGKRVRWVDGVESG